MVVRGAPGALAGGPMLAGLWFSVRLAGGAAARSDAPEDGGDRALVDRARGGDRGAYDELYRRNVDLVWHRLTRLLGPDPEREDLTQQVFLEVFGSLDRFRGEATFRTFVCRVAVYMAIDHLERRRRQPQSLAPDAFELVTDAACSPEERAEQRQHMALVWGLLDRIKPKKRVAFVLRVIDGLSLEEVAELVDASTATVAQRVRHAHDELQKMLVRRRVLP
jgi:RNA polymerase sigma-70 factor (ECF subfamily)